jgi:ParB-like chromosome segregation protein Spo0J
MSWRDHIRIHPAAAMFPRLDDAELVALGEDIKSNGLISAIAIDLDDNENITLIDGQNRLDALERVGLKVNIFKHGEKLSLEAIDADGDYIDLRIRQPITAIYCEPVEYIISTNIHRRHLTPETKRNLIAQLLKENPERSDRATAELVKVDHKTVAAVRRQEEDVGSIPHVEKRVDTKGRKQPASKPKATASAREPTEQQRAIGASNAKAAALTIAAATAPKKAPPPTDDVTAILHQMHMRLLPALNRWDTWPLKAWSSKAAAKRCADALRDIRVALGVLRDEDEAQKKKVLAQQAKTEQHADQAKAEAAPTASDQDPPAKARAKAAWRENPNATKREIEKLAGVGSKVVMQARRELEEAGEIAPPQRSRRQGTSLAPETKVTKASDARCAEITKGLNDRLRRGFR